MTASMAQRRTLHISQALTPALMIVCLLLGQDVWAQASDPDLNNDGVVNILDVSMVASCVGQDIGALPECEVADTDGDGDIDTDDLDFVTAAFGQAGFPVGPEEDTTPPDPPRVDDLTLPTNADVIRISGTSEQDAAIEIVGGRTPAAGVANSSDSSDKGAAPTYSIDVELNSGVDNTLSVFATDGEGNVSDPTVIVITRDLDPPDPPVIFTERNITSSPTQTICGQTEPGASVVVSGGLKDVVLQADLQMGLFAAVVKLHQEADNQIAVKASDGLGNESGSSLVLITHRSDAPSLGLNIVAGGLQVGFVNEDLPRDLVVKVLDDGTGDPIAGEPVTFVVEEGDGQVDGTSSLTRESDANGEVSVSWRLGPQADLEQLVIANFARNAAVPVIFMARGSERKLGTMTTFSGVVLTDGLVGVPGVTLQIGDRSTQSGETGTFLLEEVPIGRQDFHVDGSTATLPGSFPSLTYEVDILEGEENSLGRPAFLPTLDTDNAVFISGNETEPVILTTSSFPGFELAILPGSVTFPDGSLSGTVSITGVPADRVPMGLPDNGITGVIVTIQPGDVTFDPPAPISFPNIDGLAPGTRVDLTSFDHDVGDFIQIGQGTVNGNGTRIVSDPGVGIRKGAWHAAVPATRIPSTLLMGKIENAKLFDCDCWSNGATGTRAAETGEVMIPNVPVGKVGIEEEVDGVTALKATCFCKCKNPLTIPITVHIVISDDSEDRNANGVLDAGEDKDGDGVLDKVGRGSQITVAQAESIIKFSTSVFAQCCVKFELKTTKILSRPQVEAMQYDATDAELNKVVDLQKTANSLNFYFVQELKGTTVGYQAGNDPSPGVKPTGVFAEDRARTVDIKKTAGHEIGHYMNLSHATTSGKNIMEQGRGKGTGLTNTSGGGIPQKQCDEVRNPNSDGNKSNGHEFEN